jgi:hypothetical protein
MRKAPMIPSPAMLAEFKRLYHEAGDVAYHHDEFLQLIFEAATKLADGSWSVPTENIDEPANHMPR